jgi:hypothetical protein
METALFKMEMAVLITLSIPFIDEVVMVQLVVYIVLVHYYSNGIAAHC